MYYPSGENRGADQLRGYREADLRLCFRLYRLLVFPWGCSNIAICINACKTILSAFSKPIALEFLNYSQVNKFGRIHVALLERTIYMYSVLQADSGISG